MVRGYFLLKNLDPSDHVNPNWNREKLRKKQTYRRNYTPENDHEQNNDEQNDDEQNDDEQNGEDENLSNNNSNVSDRTIHVEDKKNLSTISGGSDHALSSNGSVESNSILYAETLPSPL